MSFQIILYNNISEENRIDKTNFLTEIISIEGNLKEETSITNPSILIQLLTGNEILNANYIYIPTFNRYYFIDDINSVRNQLWRIDCSVDELMSFKDIILEQNCIIERQEYDYNNDLFDSEIPIEKEIDIEYQEIQNDIFKLDESEELKPCIVVSYTGNTRGT